VKQPAKPLAEAVATPFTGAQVAGEVLPVDKVSPKISNYVLKNLKL